MKKQYDDDDGRVIADMTDVRKRSLFLPQAVSDHRRKEAQEYRSASRNNNDPFTREEGRWYLFGALRAAIMIWLVYAAAFGLFIWLLTFLFRH